MTIPKKPAGGSLDIELLCNHHFPYMRRPVMKGQIHPGVEYDYAVRLIQSGKAKLAGQQTTGKVNEDGSDGVTKEKAAAPSNPVKNLDWTTPSKAKVPEKDAKKSEPTKKD